MSDDTATNEFTSRLWKIIEKHMGCRVPLYIKNLLKLRGFDNAASIKTLSDEDYTAFETFARTKMEKYIPATSNREDYYHMFAKEPHTFEILPGHIRLLNEIVKYIKITMASHDPTFFDPDSHVGTADNSIEQSQDLGESQEKVECVSVNSDDRSIRRRQPLFKSNKMGYEIGDSVKDSMGRSQELFSNEIAERQFGVLKPLGLSQEIFKPNKRVHNILTRSKSNDIEYGRKKYIHFVQLQRQGIQQHQGELEVLQALLQNSTELDSYRSGEHCCVSHVNSISDFYIQMEADRNALKKLALYLVNTPKFDLFTDIKEGVVCVAKYEKDGLWYRGKIMSRTDDNIEVFFIDYGNSSLTKELRIIPPAISTAPSLAKHCSMVKPEDIPFWSINAEERFVELKDNETNFMVEVISPGNKAIVNLFINHKSFLEEIACLSDQRLLSASQATALTESNVDVAPESVKVLIVDGSPNQFYIQLESGLGKLDQLWDSLQLASTWPKLDEAVVGQMCAAFFEDSYYRAIVLSPVDEGAFVHYVDYGNKSISTDLRQLPDNLQNIEPIAILCSLETENGIFSPQLVDRFAKLSREKLFEMKYVSKNSIPAIVKLFENGEQFMDKPITISEPNPSTADAIIKKISPSNGLTQLDMQETNRKVLKTDVAKKTYTVGELKKIIANIKTISTSTTFEKLKPKDYQNKKESEDSAYDEILVIPRSNDEELAKTKLTMNGDAMRLNMLSKTPKFIEPIPLSDDDLVVIRYVESPTLFYTQQTKNIPDYDAMMDKLMEYCLTAPSLSKLGIGIACAALCENDSKWYRGEIVKVSGKIVLIRFVDYGIILPTEINNLKEISNYFLSFPKQAVRCCLFGFDTQQRSCKSLVDQMENLAENSLGDRRKFCIKIHGHINNNTIVNLKDTSEAPHLDLSKLMLQLSLPLDVLRLYESKMNRNGTSREPNPPVNTPIHVDAEIQDCVVNTSTFGCESADSKSRDWESCKNQQVKQPLSSRRDLLPPEGVIDPNTQIPFEVISINDTEEVTLSWFYSPLEFYVSTTKFEADLNMQMKNIYYFYKNKTPITEKVGIGSFVIAKYSQNNQLYRAEIIDYNEELNKYKARFIDFGFLTILDACNVYEMDKRFAKFERRGILCSLPGVALRTSRFVIEDAVEKYFADTKLVCKFIKRIGDKWYVDIEVDGINVKADLIKDDYLSVLSEDIEIERLVGQTVMAKIVSIKDWSSLQMIIFGCETIFEASCKDFKVYSETRELKDLPVQETVPVRINSLLIGQTFSITPLIDTFGKTPPSSICNLPFFCNNFKVLVTHWESHNIAYVQSVNADNFEQTVLTELFGYYSENGDLLQDFMPQTLCAVKSADENWYRAEIISVTETGVKVRYLDYGNCEIIPKNLVKRLQSQFLGIPALATKVHLRLKDAPNGKEISVDDIDTYTSHISLELTVLEYYARNWIVDIFKDGISITSFIETTTRCETMTVEEFKEQLDKITICGNVASQTEISGNNLQDETKSKPSLEQMPNVSQNIQIDKNSSKLKAYVSHVDRPDRFYLQVSCKPDELELDVLQENIQMAAPSLPPLEDFSPGTHCIVRYSIDDQWYRGVIIYSDTKITSVLFMDYGNTDTITDNCLIRSMNETFYEIPAFAIRCALPLEAKDRNKWSEESCQLLKDLVDGEVEFEYVCKGKANNFVKLYHGERDIMQELMQNGHAIKLDTIKSGENCYVSHVNSISDFYIQMESDTNALKTLADYLLDESKFEVFTDIKDSVVCAAKFMDDNKWYRGKIKSHTADNAEVFFIDYGNSSLTNELRIIPSEKANAPSLAKYCSIAKPNNIEYWSENAEQRFHELTLNQAVFMVDVISPGKKSIVDLFVNEKNILEEISNLCDRDSLKTSQSTLQSFPSETFKALIVDGSPGLFYIQLERNISELYQLWDSLEPATTWPILNEAVVGQMCAAIFEGYYYRAKILELNEEGATVQYIDYGNKSLSTDLRELPENLQLTEPLAIKCSLESKNGIYSPQLVDRFKNLTRDNFLEMKYVSKNSTPVIVQLFENGELFADKATEPTQDTLIKAYITTINSPSNFYIQLNNDMEEAMTSAAEFPFLKDGEICAGTLCAALWEDMYYRAQILSVDEQGIKVHFIDYGNESYATDLRKLPHDLEKIERASMLCSLGSITSRFSMEFSKTFSTLDLDQQYEFEIVDQSSPCVVRLYVNGKLFWNDNELDSNDKRENDHVKAETNNSIVTEIINEAIEIAENRYFAN